MMGEISVLMPYYQRESGILRRSLQSIFNQRHAPNIRVIIVDDGSPAPVEAEVCALSRPMQERITILHQANQGPGPARNAALRVVSEETKWIAFLDSDDCWHPNHIFRAIAALDQGFDFFFADGDADGDPKSRFNALNFRSADHVPISEDRLFEFQGDFFATILDQQPIITSTVVMRSASLGGFRFPQQRGICEDLKFWLDVASGAPRVAFSGEVAVTRGDEGVHVSHMEDWRTTHALLQILDFLDFNRDVLRKYQLSSYQRALMKRGLEKGRTDFVTTALAMLKDGKIPDYRAILKFLKRHPSAGLAFTRVISSYVRRRLAGHSTSSG